MRCGVFRASARPEMYVYIKEPETESVPADAGQNPVTGHALPAFDPFTVIPQTLQRAFGRLTPVMTLTLSEQQSLARVRVAEVMAALAEKGFYVQMPPDGLINPNAVAPEGLRGA